MKKCCTFRLGLDLDHALDLALRESQISLARINGESQKRQAKAWTPYETPRGLARCPRFSVPSQDSITITINGESQTAG